MNGDASEHVSPEVPIFSMSESPRHGEQGAIQSAGATMRPASATLPGRGEWGNAVGVCIPVKSGCYVSPARPKTASPGRVYEIRRPQSRRQGHKKPLMDWNDTEAVDDIAPPSAHDLPWRLEGAEIVASTANGPISLPMGRPGLAASQTQNLVNGKGESGYSGDMARSALRRESSVTMSDEQGDNLPALRHPFEADGQGSSLPAPVQPTAVAGQPHGSGGGGSAGWYVAGPEPIGADVESTEAVVEASAKVAACVPLSVAIEDLAEGGSKALGVEEQPMLHRRSPGSSGSPGNVPESQVLWWPDHRRQSGGAIALDGAPGVGHGVRAQGAIEAGQELAIGQFMSMAPGRSLSSYSSTSSSSQDLNQVEITIVGADSLPKARMFSRPNSFCVIKECEGDFKHVTHVVPSTTCPQWNRKFDLRSDVRGSLHISVHDKHASNDLSEVGFVKFRVIDILKRAHVSILAIRAASNDKTQGSTPDGDQEEDFSWMQSIDVRFDLLTNNGLPTTGVLQIRLRVTGKVDLKWDGNDAHVELESIASKLVSGVAIHGVGKLEADDIMFDQLSISGNIVPLRVGVEEGFYADKSAFLLSKDSYIRRMAFDVVGNRYFAFISWAFCVAALYAFIVNQSPPSFARATDNELAAIELSSFLFLGVELLLKILAHGLTGGPGCFMSRSFYDVADLLVFVSFWIECLEENLGNVNQFTLRPMRCFRILSPLKQFTVFGGLTSIFLSIQVSLVPMITIVLFLVLFAFSFAVFGMAFYRNSFSRFCVSDASNAVIQPLRWCKIFDDSSDSCPELTTCKVIGNIGPNHFDTLQNSLLVVFQALSLDEQWFVLNAALLGEPAWSSLGLLFFIFLTFFCRFMLFNICVAIVTEVFTNVRREVDKALKVIDEIGWAKTINQEMQKAQQVLSPIPSGTLSFVSRTGSGNSMRESARVHPYAGSVKQRDQSRKGSSKSNAVQQQHVVGSGFGSEPTGLNERARSPSTAVWAETETSGNRARRPSRTLGPVPSDADVAESASNRARRPSSSLSPDRRHSIAWRNTQFSTSLQVEPNVSRTRQQSSVSFLENDDGEPEETPEQARRPSSPLSGSTPFRTQYKHRRRSNVITEDFGNQRGNQYSRGSLRQEYLGRRISTSIATPGPSAGALHDHGRMPSPTVLDDGSQFPSGMSNLRRGSTGRSDLPLDRRFSSSALSRETNDGNSQKGFGSYAHRQRMHSAASAGSGKFDLHSRDSRFNDRGVSETIMLENAAILAEAKDASQISLHLFLHQIVSNPGFEVLSMFLVCVNTALLAIDSADQEWALLNPLQMAVQWCFVIELALRMIGAESLSSFFANGSDRFDFAVILVTAVALLGDIWLSSTREQVKWLASLSAFRFMRVVAIFPSIQHLLYMTLASIGNIVNLIIFTLIFLAVFAMTSVYVFCPRNNDTCIQDGNFPTFWTAMRTLYLIFTGESLVQIMYSIMNLGEVAPEDYISAYVTNISPIFFVVFYFMSQAVVINLYIAVIIENFKVSDAEKVGQGSSQVISTVRSYLGMGLLAATESLPSSMRVAFEKLARRIMFNGAQRAEFEAAASGAGENLNPEDWLHLKRSELLTIERQNSNPSNSAGADGPGPAMLLRKQTTYQSMAHLLEQRSVPSMYDDETGIDLEGRPARTLGFFTLNSHVRIFCMQTAESQWFTVTVLVTITLSCIALVLEPPSRQHEPEYVSFAFLDVINLISTFIFSIETLVQVINMGLIMPKGAYLKSAWNLVDFAVLLLSYVDIVGLAETKQARILRLGRALRPLRLIKRNQGMRLIVGALLATWSSVSMIILLAASLIVVFACIGMANFKNLFHSCNDAEGPAAYPFGKVECAGTYMTHVSILTWRGGSNGDGIHYHGGAPQQMAAPDMSFLSPRAWMLPNQNFDTFPRAMLTLAAVNCFNYVDVLRDASDTTKQDQSPLRDNTGVTAAIFFVVYTISASLFVMNLFVAFIIDGFNQLREVEQTERLNMGIYNDFYRTMKRISPHTAFPLPAAAWRVWIRTEVLSLPMVNIFFTVCVFVNVSIMGIYNEDMVEFQAVYDLQNDVFFAIMTLEAFLLFSGFGLVWLENRWALLDVFVLIFSGMAYVWPESIFVRTFRLSRIFKLISGVPALRRMFKTLTSTIVQIGNIVLLMLVVFTMFAILLVNFVGTVREGIPGPRYGGRIGSPKSAWPANPPNFSSSFRAVVVLFQIVQGDDWHLMMYDSMVAPPYCTPEFEGLSYGDCGIPFSGGASLFITFKLIAEFVLLNLFIGMILDAFMKSESSKIEFYLETPAVNVNKSSKIRPNAPEFHQVNTWKSTKFGELNGKSLSPSQMLFASLKERWGGGWKRGRDREKVYDKSCLEAWKTCTGGGKYDFIHIADVVVLMRSLPEPLGFTRNIFGEPVLTSQDRAACKLIRAELNLIAMNREVKKPGSDAWSKLMHRMAVWVGVDEPSPPTSSNVSFVEVFETIYHWRCVEYTPQSVKDIRILNLPEIVRTAHAILISKLIRRAIAVRRARKARGSAPGTTALMSWMADHTLGGESDAVMALSNDEALGKKGKYIRNERRASTSIEASPISLGMALVGGNRVLANIERSRSTEDARAQGATGGLTRASTADSTDSKLGSARDNLGHLSVVHEMLPKYVGVGQEGSFRGADGASSDGHDSGTATRGEVLEVDEVSSTPASRGAA